MPFCNFVFLFRFSLELKVKNQRRCVLLGGRVSHRAEQEVRRVVEFHSTGNHYFYIYNLFYNNFKESIPFFMNSIGRGGIRLLAMLFVSYQSTDTWGGTMMHFTKLSVYLFVISGGHSNFLN